MEGETFETEDQCNWGDTSFKTYGTPLHLPFPVRVEAGERLEQSVAVSLFGIREEPVEQAAASVPGAFPRKRNSTEPVVLTVTPVEGLRPPTLGLAGAGQAALGDAELERLRPLCLGALRADLPLDAADWPAKLERAGAQAARLAVPLELAVYVPRDAQDVLATLKTRLAGLPARVGSWLVYGADHVTAEGHIPLARAALATATPGALFGGGSDANFAELNRRRPTPGVLDKLVYAFQPQAHAFDDQTMIENVGSLRRVADTLRSFAGGAPIGISPATLRPRVDASPSSLRAPGRAPFTDDPRQKTPFAAPGPWASSPPPRRRGSRASRSSSSPARAACRTRAAPSRVRGALGHRSFDGARVVLARSRRPERVQALALQSGSRLRLFLANVTGETHPVKVEGISGKSKRAALGQADGEDAGLELELDAREIVRLDVDLA
jgi:hypothetical protein